MCKNIGFAIAATIIGLAMVFSAKSSVDASNADIARSKLAVTAHVGAPAYLPILALEPVY
jgi:hypothetical protein